jgi:hypothetical protein
MPIVRVPYPVLKEFQAAALSGSPPSLELLRAVLHCRDSLPSHVALALQKPFGTSYADIARELLPKLSAGAISPSHLPAPLPV